MTTSAGEQPLTRRLYGLVAPYKWTVAAGMVCMALAVAAELYPPLIWQRVVDVGLARRDWGYILGQVLLLLVVFAAGQLGGARRAA